ncbi:exonuclease domain-containing protein [Actinocrinis sp.]|uniref:exonuclease domain-containing protein n=1 Tax=Actinocrinis sp. TaxID=1920516 RepID=UPI002D2C3B03|nr:exonuclease domain-containing protein [Actinocrinis sp.]HZP55008.1 exonuclease domain-containing protein [Actinocrinis sp.]
MSGWAKGRLCAFDTETDCAEPEDARIITATVLFLGGGQDRVDRQWLLRPERPIPAEATAVHGITTEHAQEHGMDRAEAITQIAAEIEGAFVHGVPVVVFNAAFDFTVLDRECRRVGATVPDPASALVIDPHVIDKAVDRYRRGKRTLGATCEQYGIDLGEAHDATADALGAARLAYMLATRFPAEVGERSLAELQAFQVEWRARQSASLQEYFAKQGKDEVVDGSWPLRVFSGVVA